jgi:hypothetical protein
MMNITSIDDSVQGFIALLTSSNMDILLGNNIGISIMR